MHHTSDDIVSKRSRRLPLKLDDTGAHAFAQLGATWR